MLDNLRSWTPRRWLAVIILVAVVLRVAAALYMGDTITDLPGIQDQVSYDTLSLRVLDGYGFSFGELWWPATFPDEPTAHWSFLYTLYLSAVYAVVGHHPLVARLIQAVLAGILMPWLTYRLAHRPFGQTVALAAAGLSGVYIYFVYYAAALMTETFYIIAILWTLDISMRLARKGGPPGRWTGWGLQLGLALAVTVLLRQVFLLFIPVLFAWLLWRSYAFQNRAVGRMLAVELVAGVVLVASILPWTVRNYLVFGTFVLLNTNAGYAFFWGNHPIHGYNFIAILPDSGMYMELIPRHLWGLNEAVLDRALLERGIGFVQADPLRYVVLSLSRALDYFEFWPSSQSSLLSNISRVFSFGVLLPFMAYGVWANLRRSLKNELFLLYLFALVYTTVHLLTWALIRYRLPVDAVLVIFAGWALVRLASAASRRNLFSRRQVAQSQSS
ncbi:MAG: hypothetical protein D6784_01720 [Chloroflexi bacterium]|nr:MAG: hypothetical protein D6784_01720 [Chloroflexota bacterium]